MIKQVKTKDYKNRLLKSFPHSLKSEVEGVLNVLPLQKNKVKLSDGQIHYVENLIHSDEITFQLNGERLAMPYRLYFDEPVFAIGEILSERQKTILNCIFLRHYNGYLREKRLRNLIGKSEYWLIPFTIQLLGEYVYEILQVLDNHINGTTSANYKSFIEENPEYWQKTESRMISYWNRYYRGRFPDFEKYLGTVLVKRIIRL